MGIDIFLTHPLVKVTLYLIVVGYVGFCIMDKFTKKD